MIEVLHYVRLYTSTIKQSSTRPLGFTKRWGSVRLTITSNKRSKFTFTKTNCSLLH